MSFFVEVLGAEELYRSHRGPDASFMPVHFEVPTDAALELAMLRMPPNLNIELFQWRTTDQRTEHPRHSDRGGHHLCFVVDDVDEAIAHLRHDPGRPSSGWPKRGGFRQPLGRRQPLDILPDAMGLTDGTRGPFPSEESAEPGWTGGMEPPSKKECPPFMIIAGSTLGTPDRDLAEALRLFKTAGLDAAEVIYQDDYPAAIRPSDKKSAQQAAAIAAAEGVPIVGLTPYTTAINSVDVTSWQQRHRRVPRMPRRRAQRGSHTNPCLRRRLAARKTPTTPPTGTSSGQRSASLLTKQSTPTSMLCVENHFGTMTQTAADTARLVNEVNSPAVRVLYDQANLTFTHDENWQEAFAVQGDLIGHVHVKDLVFKDPNAPFRASDTARVKAEERAVSSRVVGTGVVPWPDIIEELVRRGYDDVLTLEYEYRWHPQDLPDPADRFQGLRPGHPQASSPRSCRPDEW